MSSFFMFYGEILYVKMVLLYSYVGAFYVRLSWVNGGPSASSYQTMQKRQHCGSTPNT